MTREIKWAPGKAGEAQQEFELTYAARPSRWERRETPYGTLFIDREWMCRVEVSEPTTWDRVRGALATLGWLFLWSVGAAVAIWLIRG